MMRKGSRTPNGSEWVRSLTIALKVEHLLAHRDAIYAAARRGGPVLYRVHADRIAKVWP